MSDIREAANDLARAIDLAGGERSSGGEGAVEVALDGEIYNRERLWRLLGADDAAGGSDADLIVALYGEFGEDLVSALDGVFAFVLRDPGEGLLLLGRDGFGLRPLSSVQPGHVVSSRPGEEPRDRRYWSPPAPTDSNAESDGDLVADLRAILTASVRARLPREGSVGVAPDGGLGASVLAAIASDLVSDSVKPLSVAGPAEVDMILDASGAEAFGGAGGVERPAAVPASTTVRSPYLSTELVEFAATVPPRLLDGGLLRVLLEQLSVGRGRGPAPGA